MRDRNEKPRDNGERKHRGGISSAPPEFNHTVFTAQYT